MGWLSFFVGKTFGRGRGETRAKMGVSLGSGRGVEARPNRVL